MSVDQFIANFSGLTEEYHFYSGEVTLVYEPKSHTYFLRTSDGELEPQSGCTSVCHIIDKSEALLPWCAKMMANKIFSTIPTVTLPEGNRVLRNMTFDEFESIILKSKTAHREKLEEAGDIGHIAHAWIENYIKAIIAKDNDEELRLLANFPFDERARNCCYAALEWMSKHNVRWLGTERKIYSRKYKFAGTMDGLCRVDSCSDPKCCTKPFKDRLTISDWKTSNYLYMEYLLQTAAYLQAYNEQEQYESWGFAPLATDRWVIRLGKEDAEFDPWHAGEETIQEDIDGFLLALELTRSVASIKARIKAKEDDARAYRKAEKKAARDAADAAEKERKAQAKLEKQQAQAEALRLTCKGYKTYQGKRKPNCNGGNPCLSCLAKYAEIQASKPQPVPCTSMMILPPIV